MSGSILATPEELRGHASTVRSKAQQAQGDFTAMRAQLESLASSFQGQAAQAFQQHWEQWHTGATQLIQGLEGLGGFLQTSADAIEDTDRQLASGLGQG